MQDQEMSARILFEIGPLTVTETVTTTWVIILLLWVAVWFCTRSLQLKPNPVQAAAEGIVSSLEDAVRTVAPDHYRQIMPFIASLWLFLVIANLVGLIPGFHSPTRDLSATSALAIMVFLSVHWFGIRIQGLKRYLHHYLTPFPFLLPFHIVSEITRTVALAIRLFGNIMSLEIAALLVLLLAGFLVPIPILMLHIVEALVQAYIFGMLALIYIASALQAQQIKNQPKE